MRVALVEAQLNTEMPINLEVRYNTQKLRITASSYY